MKQLSKLRKAIEDFYRRSIYHEEVDRVWDKDTSAPKTPDSPHRLKGIPLQERIKELDAKYDPMIEEARNKNRNK